MRPSLSSRTRGRDQQRQQNRTAARSDNAIGSQELTTHKAELSHESNEGSRIDHGIDFRSSPQSLVVSAEANRNTTRSINRAKVGAALRPASSTSS
jgi:hypothetical protein